jgi:acyl dehydratase
MARQADPDPEFDFESHRLAENRWFDDFQLGERFPLPSRTMTDALFAAFQVASGDNHPIHYDVEYLQKRGHPGLLAHGMQVLIQTAAGAGLFPHLVDDSLIAFTECTFKFLGPVYAGDTVYPALAVTDITPQRSTGILTMRATIHNQRRELVLDGSHTYLLRKRPADAEV